MDKTGCEKIMAKKRRRKKRSATIPIAIVGGLLGSFADEAAMVISGDFQGAINSLAGTFSNVQTAWSNLGPLFIGFIIHYVASKLGVNRALGRAGMPFIRI